jgi:predicted  nucleic acid-binding Zn ribbon protein
LKQIDGVEFVKCPKIFLLSGGARVPGWFYFGNRTEGQIKNLNEIREIRKWQVWHVCNKLKVTAKIMEQKHIKKIDSPKFV